MDIRFLCAIPLLAGITAIGLNHVDKKQIASETTAAADAQTAQITPRPSANEITIVNRAGEYRYSLSPTRKRMTLTITAALPQDIRDGAGSLATLHSFDRTATQAYVRKFKTSTQCPASFFNQHSEIKMMFATNPAVAKELERWKQPYWKDTRKWETATLSGRCITGTTSFIHNGQDMTDRVNPSHYKNCRSFFVEAINTREPFTAG